jgi:DNA-binding NtrC family response regulator
MKPKVLLVDDEKEFIDILSERMIARDLDVRTATSAAEALAIAGEENFDAIVLDLMMPGMDGIQALKAIKASHPDLQVILLTGHGSLEKGIEAMKLGAMDFMEKPADIDALTEKIKAAQANKMLIVEKQLEEKIKHIMNVKGW